MALGEEMPRTEEANSPKERKRRGHGCREATATAGKEDAGVTSLASSSRNSSALILQERDQVTVIGGGGGYRWFGENNCERRQNVGVGP